MLILILKWKLNFEFYRYTHQYTITDIHKLFYIKIRYSLNIVLIIILNRIIYEFYNFNQL